MSDSNKRAIRTIIQAVIALATGLPVILAIIPGGVDSIPGAAALVAWLGVVTKVINALEDAGVIKTTSATK